jgi:hypothetical protein
MPRRWKKRKPCCRGANYGLVWFEHEMGSARYETACGVSADRVYGAFHRARAELADEKAVADMIQAGTWGGPE